MNVQCFIVGVVIGAMLMYIGSVIFIVENYTDPMRNLGIERFQRCEINTTNCYSNWYEIVYKDRR